MQNVPVSGIHFPFISFLALSSFFFTNNYAKPQTYPKIKQTE